MELPILDVISRIVHVFTAVTLIGGNLFMGFVLAPSADELGEEAHQKLREAVIRRWKKFVHIGITIFILSGFYNYMTMIPNHKGDSLYHALVGTKILIAFVIFFIGSVLAGSSKTFEGMRAQRTKWLRVIVCLAAIVISISGFVKVRGIPDGVPVEEGTETPAAGDE